MKKETIGFLVQILGICIVVGGFTGSINNFRNVTETGVYGYVALVMLVFVIVGLLVFWLGTYLKRKK